MELSCLYRLGMAIGLSALSVFADGAPSVVVDFSDGVPPGWSVLDGEYRSPTYDAAVDRIELRYISESQNGSAAVFAWSNQGESQIATFNSTSSSAAFDFPDTTDFRSFRIAMEDGLSLLSFAAYVSPSELDASTCVVISNNTTGTSFDASWRPVVGATGYRVYVWTNNVVGASEGSVLWRETFANSPAKSSSVDFDVSYTDSGESPWAFYKAYAHSEAGMVRVGNTSTKGALVSPPLPKWDDSQLTFLIVSWRQTTSEGQDMPLGIVSGGETNIFGAIRLGDESKTYHLALPELNAGDSIAIFSPTNKASARAIIDEVAIISKYNAGTEVPSYVVDGRDVGEATSCRFENLPSVPVFFAVEAYGKRGVTSAKTDAVTIDLANPDKVAVLNACPISSLAANIYVQDFDSLATITATTGEKAWLNGTTLLYWQAYKGDAAVDVFKYNGGAIKNNGLYALAANQNHSVRALGVYSGKNNEYAFGIAFTNDTDKIIALSSVEYSAQQWGFGNTTNQTLSLCANVVDGLDWILAYDDGWTELVSTQSAVYDEGNRPIPPVAIPVLVNPRPAILVAPGQVLALKWTVHSLESGSPGIMAVDDVSVSFIDAARLNAGFSIRIANKSVRQ